MSPSGPMLNALAAVVATLMTPSVAGWSRFTLNTTYNSTNFFQEFALFESTPKQVDPTHGFVRYRNLSDAQALGLAAIRDKAVYLGVDHTSYHLNVSDIYGRDSVRPESVAMYKHGLFVWDMAHLPARICGTWPAIWTYGDNWPENGEMDIYENWNDNFRQNRQTLHTNNSEPGCAVYGRNQTSRMETTDCNVANKTQPPNNGCSSDRFDGSYGNPNGGVFAMLWSSKGIRMWNWPQGAAPADLTAEAPRPHTWGIPAFNTMGDGNRCAVEQLFGPQRLVFDITFCGDAAAADRNWNLTSCYLHGKSTCQEYVANHPGAFAEVYFLINSIKIYNLPKRTHSADPDDPDDPEDQEGEDMVPRDTSLDLPFRLG